MKTIAINILVAVSALILVVGAIGFYMYKSSQRHYNEMNTFQFVSANPDNGEQKTFTFNIPGKYSPIMNSDSIITFYIVYPSMESYHPSRALLGDGIMARIILYPNGKMRSVTALNQTSTEGRHVRNDTLLRQTGGRC
ncbi:MAG: hypothetical protein IPN81_01600 [Nitrosomonadales bacterium]|nr:hypothetical protein [Nitrosomonadales bacterium]